ncbi:MAG: hypothetical protein J6C04_05520 [Oscillospiraceae bacterium]|nr:hypothetical protein [Oscillospiraceae bacterium]
MPNFISTGRTYSVHDTKITGRTTADIKTTITREKASVEQQIQRGQQSLARYVELQYDRQEAEEQLLKQSRKKQQGT